MRFVSWKRDRPGFLSITQRETASASVALGMWATRMRCPSCPQPRRRRLPPARPPSACGRPAPGADAARCTTRFSNAHRTVCRELLYRLHPWFECDVFVHSAIDKADGGVFRCTLDGSEAGRWLEIPAWMFDRAACVTDVRSLTDPFVSLEALGALSVLLDQVLKTDAPSSNARLRDAYGISRDQNRGETHGREDGVSDRDSAQTAPRVTADGYVRKPGRARRAGLARPAEGRTGGAARADDTPDPRACAGDSGANNGGGRP